MERITSKVRGVKRPDAEHSASGVLRKECYMRELLFVTPVFKDMIWGGNRLREFGYTIPSEQTGECWAISAHPNGDCEIKCGTYVGKRLSELWAENRELFGGAEGDRYPLLIKIIDAKADLSIQVHPDDAYAMEHENGSFGKTECWYILDCDEGATIVIGHNAKDSAEVADMIHGARWSELIREIPVHKGDFFQIDPGCVHAIKGGTVILETQQNSDITYRVYDYDRLQNGKPRQLHVEQSIAVIKAPYVPQSEAPKTYTVGDCTVTHYISCDYYTVEKLELNGTAEFAMDKAFVNVSVAEGSGEIDGTPVKKGDHFIIPAGYGNYVLTGNMMLIRSNI